MIGKVSGSIQRQVNTTFYYLHCRPNSNGKSFNISVVKEKSHLIYLPYSRKLKLQEIHTLYKATFRFATYHASN